MKILNVMFGKGLGGIEQVFLDYNHALNVHHHQVVPVIHPKASIKNKIYGHYESIFNFNKLDPFAIYKLRKLIQKEQPNCIITHGNRATTLVRRAAGNVPVIAVCHNYKYKPLIGSDAIISITNDIKNHLIKDGQPEDAVYRVPNMIMLPENHEFVKPEYRDVPVIGFIGRFVKKKGVDVLLKALAAIDARGIEFKAKIAGGGEERKSVERYISDLKLDDKVEMIGWVDDKDRFYNSIDVLTLPSYHEPFGLVMLEAFKYSKPLVSTSSEGPSEIAEDGKEALFSPVGDPQKLAENIIKVIEDQNLAIELASNGYKLVQEYSPWIVGRRLQNVLEQVVFKKLTGF